MYEVKRFFVYISLVISFYIKNEKEKELLHQSYMTLRDTLIDTLVDDKTQVGLNWKYPISELIKLRFTR